MAVNDGRSARRIAVGVVLPGGFDTAADMMLLLLLLSSVLGVSSDDSSVLGESDVCDASVSRSAGRPF